MSEQVSFDFLPGLTDRFKSLKETTLAVAQSGTAKQSTIAAECDVSPSEFSKSVYGAEGRRFELDWLEKILDETHDYRPIYYLMEKYLESPEAKQRRVVEQLSVLLPQAMEFLKQAGVNQK